MTPSLHPWVQRRRHRQLRQDPTTAGPPCPLGPLPKPPQHFCWHAMLAELPCGPRRPPRRPTPYAPVQHPWWRDRTQELRCLPCPACRFPTLRGPSIACTGRFAEVPRPPAERRHARTLAATAGTPFAPTRSAFPTISPSRLLSQPFQASPSQEPISGERDTERDWHRWTPSLLCLSARTPIRPFPGARPPLVQVSIPPKQQA
mmetsp:Transcript_117794/g.375542  ORF Transcript_117794/g.375542 Transcript_117794/m.375542 type:complete len:203 (-) Transcript_117794:752-1360(-)